MKPVRPSLIATARKSMLAYKHRRDQPMEPTPSMRWGSLVDAFLFKTGLERFAIWDGTRRGIKWEDFQGANKGRIIVSPEEYQTARECSDALLAHPAVAQVLAQGEAQVPIEWTDEESGLQCAGRPDFLSSATGLVIDLKTTSGGLSDRLIASTVDRWGYGLQLAMYRMGLRAQGIDLNPGFIFCESEEPYDAVVYAMLPEQVDDMEREARRLLKRIAECERTGVWPGVSSAIQTLSLPHWAFGPAVEEAA